MVNKLVTKKTSTGWFHLYEIHRPVRSERVRVATGGEAAGRNGERV